jgi:sterol desaturase/sphingolipid hydroxylase (fatty acid hydroxylase superfamily)
LKNRCHRTILNFTAVSPSTSSANTSIAMPFDFSFWLTMVTKISGRYLLLATVSFLVFYVVFKKQFQTRKIQSAFPKLGDYGRDLLHSLVSVFIFATMAYVVIVLLKPYNHFIKAPFNTVSIWYHLFSFGWLFFLHDAYFYWIHRLMHVPFLFKHVHLVHHRSTNPSPWTAYAFHPLEALLEAGIIAVAAFTVPVHTHLFGSFMLFQILYNIYGHLGYELYPRMLEHKFLGKWINTGVAHNQHHKFFKGNYGLYTLIWDRMLGTLRKDYSEAMQHYGHLKKQ